MVFKPIPMKNTCVASLSLFLLAACIKDKPQSAAASEVQLSDARKVYTVNEGVYPNDNASVSLYDPGTAQVIENFYATQNNNAVVGDVAQSLSYINSSYYLVVNNSGKILVCDRNFKKTGQITNLLSPRYIQPVTNQKAYVSDYKSNSISIINLNSETKTGVIPCPGWTEHMVMIYNKVFVTNMRRNYLYVVNTLTDAISDSIYVGLNAANVVLDRQDKLWVLSGGDKPNSVAARLWKINPVNNQVETSLVFNDGETPGNLCLNRTRDTLWYLNNGICRFSTNDASLPAHPFITAGSKNFYGLGVNPNDYMIYAADALDYNQRANVYIYDAGGDQKSWFKAGINTNGFYFE